MEVAKSIRKSIEETELKDTPKKYTGQILSILCKKLNFKYGSILFFDENNKAQVYLSYQLPEYHPIFFDNIKFSNFEEIKKAEKGLGNVFIIDNIAEEPFFGPWKVLISSLDLYQIVIIPLIAANKTIGLMVLYSPSKDTIPQENIHIVEQYTSLIIYSIIMEKTITGLKKRSNSLTKEVKEARKKQEILKNNEKQYKDLLENMGEGLSVLDKEENFLFANHMMEKIFGVEQYELMGRNLREFMTEEEFGKILKQTQQRKRGKKSKYQVTIKTPDGETKVCSITASPYYDEEGAYIGSFGLFRDITAAKWTESIQQVLYKISEAANTSETLNELFRSIHKNLDELMNTNNFYIALYNEDSEIITFPYFVDELDPPPQPRKPQKGLTEYVISTAKPLLATREIKQELIEKKEVKRVGPLSVDWLGVPLKIRNKPIGVLVVQSYTEEIRFGENEKNILVFVSEQIAMAIDKKKSEESLIQKQIQLKEAQRIAKLGSWEKNFITGDEFYSSNFFEIMNISSEEEKKSFSFKDHLDKVHTDDKEKFTQNFNSENTLKQDHFNFPYKIIDSTGKIRYISSVGLLRYNDKNEPYKLTVTIQDVTEQKSTEELVKEMEITKKSAELKQQFLANMSHEIRTPLNAIIGFAKLLDQNIKDSKEKGYIQTILSSSNTLLVLINDILDLSKIEAGKMEIKYTPVDIKNLIKEILKLFSIRAEEKNLELKLDIEKNFPYKVYLDSTRLRQIFLNIVGNAIKFTEKGLVKIIVRNHPSEKSKNLTDITIKVKDTGIGIPGEQQNKIFNTFTQVSGQSHRKYGGTGLGLSITKKLVEIMGGMLYFESEMGIGSEFTVEIPRVLIAIDEQKEKISAEYLEESLPYEDIRLLLVDPDDITDALFNELIEISDLEILETDSRIKSIASKLKQKPDLIMLNMIRNNISNSRLLKELKSIPEIKQVPVLAIVEPGVQMSLDQLQNYNIDGILRRTFSTTEIKQILYKYLTFKKRIDKKKQGQIGIDLVKFVENIDDNTKRNLPGIIQELNKKYLPEFEMIKKSPRIQQIKDTSLRLKKFGKKHNLMVLTHFGEKLNKEAGDFNIERMRKLSEYFPELINLLEEEAKQINN